MGPAAPVYHAGYEDAYMVGLTAANNMKKLFNEFYGQHVAGMNITPATMLGVAGSFLCLVSEVLPLWGGAEDICFTNPDPVAHLTPPYDYTDEQYLQTLFDFRPYIERPHPWLYGHGAYSALDYGDGADLPLLTLALWRLLEDTPFGMGIDISIVLEHSDLSRNACQIILDLKPVAPVQNVAALAKSLPIPCSQRSSTPSKADLLAYPFAQTGLPMADSTNYEVEVMYGGYYHDDWDELPLLVDQAREASMIQEAYNTWCRTVENNPMVEIPALGKACHKAARQLREKEVREEQENMALLGVAAAKQVDRWLQA